ncbi:MAG: hypothetical protein WCW47_03395 [Candidatus Paceibacterota bacterium]|jgi:hypothetical protein
MELDILGAQIMLALQFRESGFDVNLPMRDDVDAHSGVAQDVFSKGEGDQWFMTSESIPGHLGIKAIVVEKDRFFLETSPFKLDEVRQAIVERMLPFELRELEDGLGFIDLTTGKKLISVGKPVKPEFEGLGLRCLWTIELDRLDAVRTKAVVEMADIVFSIDAYDVEEDDEVVSTKAVHSVAVAQRISQQLQLGLQQRLQMEQRPVLSRRMVGTTSPIPEMRLELSQIMALNRRLLHMKPEELPQFFTEYIAKHGEKRALEVAIFTLAGKVKQAKPHLSWRETRRIARNLMTRTA